jgi:hypothetical protein
VTVPGEDTWLDGDAGRLIRPYAVTNGRTAATLKLDLTSMAVATGAGPGSLGPDHLQALELCARPASVAEVAARLRLPAAVTKILLSDLADSGAVRAAPKPASDTSNRVLLEQLLDGLQRRL